MLEDFVIPTEFAAAYLERKETVASGIDWKETMLLWRETGEHLLTVREAAEVLGERPSRVYRLIRYKKLVAINFAREHKRPIYRIPPANVVFK